MVNFGLLPSTKVKKKIKYEKYIKILNYERTRQLKKNVFLKPTSKNHATNL